MRISWKRSIFLACAGLVCAATMAAPVQGGEFWKLFTPVTAPAEAAHREKPATSQDPPIEQLGRQIDWLEHQIDDYGTVVAKHPDVWGESRLTLHRAEYEAQMSAMLGQFSVNYQAAIARNDQAYLGWAMTLNSAAAASGASSAGAASQQGPLRSAFHRLTGTTSAAPATATATSTGGTPVFSSSNVSTLSGMIGAANPLAPAGPPFSMTAAGQAAFGSPNTLSLEPKMMLLQMDGYLHSLQQLRRNNEGDDTKDSPGYALDLVRIPVSVLPGRKTREGYGAEITVTAIPDLTEELLPTTFRSMCTNDLVGLLAPAVTQWVNDSEIQTYCREITEKKAELWKSIDPVLRVFKEDDPKYKIIMDLFSEGRDSEALHRLQNDDATSNFKDIIAVKEKLKLRLRGRAVPFSPAFGTKSRRAYLPIPPSQIVEVLGGDMMTEIVWQTYSALGRTPANWPVIAYMDVRNYLAEEVNAAYLFLGERAWGEPRFQQQARKASPSPLKLAVYNESQGDPVAPGPEPPPVGQCVNPLQFWNEVFCGRQLALAIRARSLDQISSLRKQYTNCIYQDRNGPVQWLVDTDPRKSFIDDAEFRGPRCKFVTTALGWGLLVEASLLNEQLNRDYYDALIGKGVLPPDVLREPIRFYGPKPPPPAPQKFIEYVKCRWPVRVFALDPMADVQNVEDSYSRHRQLQIALAMGFAAGKINAQTMMKFARQMDLDMQAVALNQTAVGFSHGDDTFGWRFYPRFQTPPTPGNAAVFWQSLAGGPTTDQDLRRRQLEPMQRECTAIVIMPSFVPYVTFDTRTRFFKLTNPEHGEVGMRETLELSRSIKAMQSSAAQCSACAQLYRDGEVDRLLRRVHQLENTLPLQTMQVQLPFEETAGGFELFNRGVTDLSPELIGWYGAPGIDPGGTTTLFLVGRSFSVNGMQVIAGGRAIPPTSNWQMLSRQVLQVTIPPGSQFLIDDAGNKFAEIHVATAYGVTDHLLVPITPTQMTKVATGPDLAFVPMQTAVLTYTTTAANTYAMQGYSSPKPYVEISYAQAVPVLQPTLNVNLYLVDPNGTAMGMQSGVTFVYSPQTGRYGTPLDGILWAKGTGTIADAAAMYMKNTFTTGKIAPSPLGFTITAQVVPPAGASSTPLVPVTGAVGLQIKSQ